MVQATPEEQAAITQFLKERAESAPAGKGLGRASALVRAGLKIAGVLLLGASVEIGYLDGNEFDDVGCSVAMQPSGSSHDVRSAQAGERAGGKLPGSDGGAAGGSDGSGPDGQPECEVRAAMCAHRLPDGRCQMSMRQCLLFAGASDVSAMVAGVHREIAAVRRKFGELRDAPAAVPESVARQVFALVHELETEGRWRKAPMLRVFRLYCVEGLPAVKIARQCRCSKSLVLLRLKRLRTKLGRNPAELRQMSSQFEEIEASLKDDRARRIHRESAMDEHERDEWD